MALDPQVKQQWVQELRSGKHKQATGQLCLKDVYGNVIGMCCLGVLGNVLGYEFDSGGYPIIDGKRYYSACFLPVTVGIYSSIQNNLANMNDGTEGPQQNFNAIADFIEEDERI